MSYFDDNEDRIIYGGAGRSVFHRDPKCNRCGSTDVRWRQQGGKWVLFSLQPGVVHACEPSADDFSEVK
jgi:hypothetical protein